MLLAILATGVQARYTHTTPRGVGLSQYANIAPLPGAGVALNASGEPDGQGAFQINIPVAYTPGWGYVSGAVYGGAHVGGPTSELGNGTGVFGAGFFSKPKIFVSGMKVSHLVDDSMAVNGQVALVDDTPTTPAIALGEQDILGKELDGTSPYVVLTKSLQIGSRPLFATLGYGGGRFINRPFGGLSVPIGNSLNLAVENDGYQLNGGLGWRPGGRNGRLTFMTGFNGKCGWVVGFNIAGGFGSR
jgi:hypothetical protein